MPYYKYHYNPLFVFLSLQGLDSNVLEPMEEQTNYQKNVFPNSNQNIEIKISSQNQSQTDNTNIQMQICNQMQLQTQVHQIIEKAHTQCQALKQIQCTTLCNCPTYNRQKQDQHMLKHHTIFSNSIQPLDNEMSQTSTIFTKTQASDNVLQQFHQQQYKWKQTYCDVCSEMWPVRSNNSKSPYVCFRCKRDKNNPKTYSMENNMNPGSVPQCLLDLTQIEEMLIARVTPIMYVYRKQGGQRGYKGHILNLSQDVQSLLDVLPPRISDLPILVLRRKGANGTYSDFTVRRQKVLNALLWLQQNNPFYKSISIDHMLIEQLPENGVPNEIFHTDQNTLLTTGMTNKSHTQTNSEVFETTDQSDTQSTSDDSDIDDTEANHDLSQHNYTSFVPTPHAQETELDYMQRVINNNTQLSWPTLSQTPVNEFDTEGLATMAFPTLFPYGTGDPTTKNRSHHVGYAEFFKHLMRFAENAHDTKWRFASHPRFPYWALNMKQRHNLLSQANVYLKQHPSDARLSVQQLRDMVGRMDSEQLMSRLHRYVSKVHGTKQYWYQRSLELKALIQNKGPPTFFWTVSSADTYWPELHKLMPHNNEDLSHPMRIQAVIRYPHITDWYFTNRLSDFVQHWLYNEMEAEWHWYRLEYQSRGSTHAHGCAKLKTDPGLCNLIKKAALAWEIQNSEVRASTMSSTLQQEAITEGNIAKQTVVNYCDWLTSTFNNSLPSEDWRMPSPNNHPSAKNPLEIIDYEQDYNDLVNTVERHTRCNPAYCLRKKSGETQLTCRFDYPCPIQDNTEIQFETLPNGRIRAKVITKRNDPLINTHNRKLLQHWRANVDLQVIVDIEDCVRYMTKYAAKAETKSQTSKQIFQTCVRKLTQTSQTQSAIRSAMIKSIGERDFSAQETAHMLLGLPLYSCTYTFTTLCLDNSRTITIHSNVSSSEMSTTLSIIDFYAKRKDLETLDEHITTDMNLLQFCSQYHVYQNKLRKRQKEVIIRSYPSYSSDPEGRNYAQYCKYQLIKYKPWQTETCNAWDNLSDTDENYITCYHNFVMNHNAQRYLPQIAEELENIEIYLHQQQTQNNDTSDNEDENIVHHQNQQEEWMLLCQLNTPFQQLNNIEDNPDIADNINWQSLIKYVTQDQILESANWINTKRKEYPHLLYDYNTTIQVNTLNTEQRLAYDIVDNHYRTHMNTTVNSQDGLLMIICGTAGTGKSYLINAISCLLNTLCCLTATTGIAAFHIHGVTIHSLLQLPIRGQNNTELQGSALMRLQEKLKNKKYIIIDEMSMLGQNSLTWIDRRLRQGTGQYDKPFGGMSVILIGDFGQLPPIGDKPLYVIPKLTDNDTYNHGYLMYKQFTTVVQLKQMMRQDKATENFRLLLSAIRNGKVTHDHWQTLLTRSPLKASNSADFDAAIHLFFDKQSVAEYNYQQLHKLGNTIARIEAMNSDHTAKVTNSDEAGGLDCMLFISNDCEVMLTSNLWQQAGLCNGAIGIVKDILFAQSQKPPSLPISVLVEFPKYTGPPFIAEHPKYVPIPPITFEWTTNKRHSRKQIPLRLCYAMTIHKSQGQTLEKAVIDLGDKERTSGLTFVALSRLKDLNHCLIKPMTYDRLQSISNSKQLKTRIKEEEHLQTISNHIVQQQQRILNNT